MIIADWFTLRTDGVGILNVRATIETDDGALIGIAIDKGFIKGVNQPVLDFFKKRDAFKEAEYLMAATPQTWKKILRKERDFVTEFILGKINLEMGTKVSMLELAHRVNNVFDFFTQVDLQFRDEMSEDELTTYRSKMEAFRHAKGT